LLKSEISKKFILNFTPTGMIPTKEMTPHVPITPDEIVKDVSDVLHLGVNMVHLHARDPVTGLPTFKKEIYSDIINGIRNLNKNIIICVSTSGRKFKSFEERSECMDLQEILKPEFASLTLSSLNFNKEASINSPDMIKSLAKKMKERNIKPEMEVFDLGMINFAKYLIGKGLIEPPYYFNLILGNIACAQADILHLGMMIRELPSESIWSVGGIGSFQLPMNILSIVSGGGVRIGIEDNIWFDKERTKLATNISLIKRITTIADSLGCQPYTLEEARRIMNIYP